MRRYFLKRALLAIPVLMLVSIIAFFLRESIPGNPVARSLPPEEFEWDPSGSNKKLFEQQYRAIIREHHLDKPAFYFSLTPVTIPDSLHKLLPLEARQTYQYWCQSTGDPAMVSRWWQALDDADRNLLDRSRETNQTDGQWISGQLAFLRVEDNSNAIRHIFDQWPDSIAPEMKQALSAAMPIPNPDRQWRNLIPTVRWYGADNRFHIWWTGFFSGRDQKSLADGQAIGTKIWQSLRWTLLMNLFALLLAYGISIPLGVWMAGQAGGRLDRWLTIGLFTLYAVPVFWLATLLLIFFTSSHYGMAWFPSLGLGDLTGNEDWLSIFRIRASHLFLPVLCLTYGSLAYLTRQVRNQTLNELKQPYIRTAWMNGLSKNQILWRHVFPNASLPLITHLGQLFPSLITGSIAVEVIFNIPGMGRLMYVSILGEDWPVVYHILFIGALLTILGGLIADWFYTRVDPRIRFSK